MILPLIRVEIANLRAGQVLASCGASRASSFWISEEAVFHFSSKERVRRSPYVAKVANILSSRLIFKLMIRGKDPYEKVGNVSGSVDKIATLISHNSGIGGKFQDCFSFRPSTATTD